MTDKSSRRVAEDRVIAGEHVEDEVMDEVLNSYSEAVEDETSRSARDAAARPAKRGQRN